MQGKLNKLVPLGNSDTSPIDGAAGLIVNITVNEKSAIQVIYGAGSAGNLTLSGSLFEDPSTFAVLTNTTQAMDVAGGSHLWNVDNMFFKFIRVDLPAGGLQQSVYFAGNTPIVRA